MVLKEYTCKLDGFTAQGSLGFPEEFWRHIEEVHGFNVLDRENRDELRRWIREHVEEESLIDMFSH